MSELLKNQKFGVEVEFTGITRKKAASIVASTLGTVEAEPNSTCYHTQSIRDNLRREWKIMRDSSISPSRNDGSRRNLDEYRVEFVTPPLHYNDIELLQTIIRNLKAEGAKANTSCGIHIHVDGANHTATSLRRLVNFMQSRQDIIYDALKVGNRKNNWCRPICEDLNKTIRKEKNLTNDKLESIWYSNVNDNYRGGISHQHYNDTRYHALNLHAFFSKGTVEFRLFNSTLHAGKIKAYIQFCLAMSAWAIESDDKVVFRKVTGYSVEKKVTLMYHILTNRLGLYGEEFKTCRYHMMRALKDAATTENVA